MRVLVADDDPLSRLLAETSLRRLGHECEAVGDGAEAWEAFRSRPPDVVISDWMMPGLDGLELCRNIRGHAADNYTYFILVTGQGAPAHAVEGMSSGADDYLVKPLNPDDLQLRLIAAERVTSLHRQLAEQRSELVCLNDDLTELSLRDSLTGLGNRRALEEDLALLQARATRYGHRYCIAMVDVDHFKSYNDTYGHQAGDEALASVAGVLKAEARGGDAIFRYGGEEFACILPEQSAAKAAIAAERMRRGVEQLATPHAQSSRGVLTVSIGLAVLDQGHTKSVSEILKDADGALYLAKQLGRNRVQTADPESTAGGGFGPVERVLSSTK